MRTILFIFSLLFCTTIAWAQSPQAVNYQAQARDTGGNTLVNTPISVRFSILSGSPTGPVLYAETHSATTNQYGLFNLAVGTGSVQSGNFAGIDWSIGDRYLKVEFDPNAGTTYLQMGTSQLLSVPYALFANTANSADSASFATSANSANSADTAAYAWNAQASQFSDTASYAFQAGSADSANHAATATFADSAAKAPNQLPAGSSGQTLRYGAAGWEASSNIYNNATNVGIGTTNPTSRLQVNGTATVNGFAMPVGAVNGYVLTTNASGNGTWQPAAAGGGSLDDAYDNGGAGAGRVITADAGAVEINTTTANGTGLDLNTTATGAIGLRSDLTSAGGVAIRAESSNPSNTFSTIQATTNSNSTIASAIVGSSTGAAPGVSGQVMATGSAQQAVYGSNLRANGGHGVRGIGLNGVVGENNYRQGYAVYGENFDTQGSGNGVGVAGRGYRGVFGEDRYLGTVTGAYGVYSNGDFAATGLKSFNIDHPKDPENKYLRHFSLESNEVLNMYRGTIRLDQNGEATVTLPDYFQDINQKFSYHLTPIGGFAQLYIKQKVQGDEFVIAGGSAGLEVSWMLIAERNDPYLQQNPQQKKVVIEKPDREKGKYLIPSLYGQPAEKGVFQSPVSGEEKQPVIKMK